MNDGYVVGIDLGGTKIALAVSDLEGNILAKTVIPTRAPSGANFVIGNIVDASNGLLSGLGLSIERVSAIGIGCPGPINPQTGVVVFAPNLGWKDVKIVEEIQSMTGVPAYLENDANVAGLAEVWFGAGKGVSDLIYLTVSTGVGGGIIIDRKIHQGAHFSAGEVGHMIVDVEGPICNCGRRGCLEAISSGTGITRRTLEALEAGEKSIIPELVNGDLSQVTPATVGEAAKKGDELAARVLERAFRFLGIGIANLLDVFDPELVVIGGGVSKLGDQMFEPVRAVVRETAVEPPRYETRIVPAELGDDVGLVGALTLALDKIKG